MLFRSKHLDETGARWVAIIIQGPTLVPKMRGKIIELVRRVDEQGPVFDKPKGLTFLLPRGLALSVHDGGGVPADDVNVLKGEKGHANVFCKRENAVFQPIGVWNAPCETTYEAVTRRLFVHDAHSPLLNKRVSVLVELTRE